MKLGGLHFNLRHDIYKLHDLRKAHNLAIFQLPHVENGDNRIYLADVIVQI